MYTIEPLLLSLPWYFFEFSKFVVLQFACSEWEQLSWAYFDEGRMAIISCFQCFLLSRVDILFIFSSVFCCWMSHTFWT